ncbi:hypothetical protein MN0502_15900 [Arthrobacter sp. MN05-02]|nr:hypothetical protein MN0502_15900 [Arthrobacter sp. MN05-02]
MEELTFVFARLKGILLTEGKAGRAVEDLAEAVKKSIPGFARRRRVPRRRPGPQAQHRLHR